jgi:hypothetical protein
MVIAYSILLILLLKKIMGKIYYKLRFTIEKDLSKISALSFISKCERKIFIKFKASIQIKFKKSVQIKFIAKIKMYGYLTISIKIKRYYKITLKNDK